MDLRNFLIKSWKEGTDISRSNILTAVFIGAPAHIFLYFFHTSVIKLPYESPYLRFGIAFLCASVYFYPYLSDKIKRCYFPAYWHFMVTMALTLNCTFCLLKANFNEIYLYWQIVVTFLLSIYVPNWFMFLVDLILSILIAISAYILSGSELIIDPAFNVIGFLAIYIFVILFGVVTSVARKLEKVSLENWSKDFAHSISDEMQNPLDAVKSALDDMKKILPQSDEDKIILQKADLQDINRVRDLALSSIKRANEIMGITLNNIKGKVIDNKNFVSLSIAEVAREAAEEYGYKNNQDRKRVVLYVEEDFSFLGNETLMIYVLFNFFKDALKNTEKNPDLVVTIRTKKLADKNIILICDNSTESFVGNDSSAFGFDFCKRAIKSFGGEIKIKSTKAKQREFEISLPIFDEEQTQKRKKLLIVDDQKVNLMLTKALLERNLKNSDCHTAINGIEAVQKFSQNSYDLVLMDLQMPQMDGFEASKLIREINQFVPIIAYSSLDSLESRQKAKSHGITDYIAKPSSNDLLLETIRKFLG